LGTTVSGVLSEGVIAAQLSPWLLMFEKPSNGSDMEGGS
jgi:hypothetical protein